MVKGYFTRQATMTPDPYWHEGTEAVRFWVMIGDQSVGATISRRTLHHHFAANRTDDQPLATYQTNANLLHDAVRRRVAGGSIEPVMLREHDLAPPLR